MTTKLLNHVHSRKLIFSLNLEETRSIKGSRIWEDGSVAAEAVFTSPAAVAARVHLPAAPISAPCWLDKEKGILSDFGLQLW